MSKNEALRLALRYIKATNKNSVFWLVPESELNKTVFAIKQALEQPEHSCIACEGNPKGKNNPCNVCGLAQPEPKPVVTLEKLLEKNK